MQLGLQLYTLRDHLKTPADIAATLGRVAKVGYKSVQVSGMGPISPAALRKILDDNGLTCCATHVPLDRLEKELSAVVEEQRILGCGLTAIGGYWPKPGVIADWNDFIQRYSSAAEAAQRMGIRIGYHNHSHEFARPHDELSGPIIMQRLIDRCSPAVWFEFDTYWIQHGGGDPSVWIQKLPGRVPVVHFKDMAFSSATAQPVMAEIGEGNLPWRGIITACQSANVQWAIVEQDVCQRDPFESITISFRNCLALGLQV
jgi:sugar phosphate isomerase/epimerase